MREQYSSKPAAAGIRRHYRRCAPATPHIAAAFLLIPLGALYLVFGPASSDLNLIVTMPRVRVVFDQPAAAAVPAAPAAAAAAAAPAAPSNATTTTTTAAAAAADDDDSALPPPRQLTDPPYSLGRAILDYDARRSAWLAAHPDPPPAAAPGRPRVLVVTGSSPSRCPDAGGDHLLLRAFKNKADYCRAHGLDVFYGAAFLAADMTGFWAKLPLLRALMLAHPEVELLWWVDADAVFTDMAFEPPWERYAGHNLVLHGWPAKVFDERSWVGVNTGSFLLRNCQWSLDLLDAWAPMGARGPVRDRYGELFARELAGRPPFEADDQSALVYLLVTQRGRWGEKTFIESAYELNGFWEGIVDRYEEMRRKGRGGGAGGGVGDDRWPFVTHFVGCKPCRRYADSYPADRCRRGMERALNFADDQILRLYGFEHRSLNTTAVQRVGNETGGAMDADDEELRRLLHPTFRAASGSGRPTQT